MHLGKFERCPECDTPLTQSDYDFQACPCGWGPFGEPSPPLVTAEFSLWTVYASPRDYPGKFVARRWAIRQGQAVATDSVRVADTLADVRAALPRGMHRIVRAPVDDACIVESWV